MNENGLGKPSANLARLRELVSKYQEFEDLISPPVNGIVNLNVSRGAGTCYGVLKKQKVAILDSSYEERTVFPSHSHEEQEFLIVYSGKLSINVSGELWVIGVGESIRVPSGAMHSVWTEGQPCNFIAITVPASVSFPEVSLSGVAHDEASG